MPPPLELECLKVLWTIGEGNVNDVRQRLASERTLAYTTVMTVLDRLARKGGVARRKVGRTFTYSPLLSRDSLRRLAIQVLLRDFFDGREEALMDYLRSGQAREHEYLAPAQDDHLDAALL
jgi:predicted transcriptional regulator